MKSALVRLCLISFCTLFLLTLALVWLRFLGGLQEYKALEHPLLNNQLNAGPWQILKISETHPQISQVESWLKEQSQKPNSLVWLDLRRSRDGKWFFSPMEWVAHPEGKRAVSALSFKEIQDLWPDQSPTELSQIFQMAPDASYWLNITEKDPFWIGEFKALVPEVLNKKIVVSSQVKQFGKKLRESQPEWLFANDPSTLNQMLMLESVFLEPIMSFWPDIFFASSIVVGRDVFTPRMITELRRRNIPVVLEVSANSWNQDKKIISTSGLVLKGIVSQDQELLNQALQQIPSK